MLGRIIFFLIILIIIFAANAYDFFNLIEGVEHRFIQCFLGVLYTSFALMCIPRLVFDIRGKGMYIAIIILEAVYITIYTFAYFRIKKRKEEEKNKYGRRNNKK